MVTFYSPTTTTIHSFAFKNILITGSGAAPVSRPPTKSDCLARLKESLSEDNCFVPILSHSVLKLFGPVLIAPIAALT